MIMCRNKSSQKGRCGMVFEGKLVCGKEVILGI